MAKNIGTILFILCGGFVISTIVDNIYYSVFSSDMLNIIFYSVISLLIFLVMFSIKKLRQNMFGYMLIVLVPTMIETSYVMKSLNQSNQGLVLDFSLYIIIASILTLVLYFTTDFKKLFKNKDA